MIKVDDAVSYVPPALPPATLSPLLGKNEPNHQLGANHLGCPWPRAHSDGWVRLHPHTFPHPVPELEDGEDHGLCSAPPPEIESVGGEFAGAKAEVKLVAQDRQLISIEQRVSDIEESHAALVAVVKQMREECRRQR